MKKVIIMLAVLSTALYLAWENPESQVSVVDKTKSKAIENDLHSKRMVKPQAIDLNLNELKPKKKSDSVSSLDKNTDLQESSDARLSNLESFEEESATMQNSVGLSERGVTLGSEKYDGLRDFFQNTTRLLQNSRNVSFLEIPSSFKIFGKYEGEWVSPGKTDPIKISLIIAPSESKDENVIDYYIEGSNDDGDLLFKSRNSSLNKVFVNERDKKIDYIFHFSKKLYFHTQKITEIGISGTVYDAENFVGFFHVDKKK
tara:strand:+ start:49257 stop:50030 length:774 start_codon:yes stop_codon:yes gene_type:complete